MQRPVYRTSNRLDAQISKPLIFQTTKCFHLYTSERSNFWTSTRPHCQTFNYLAFQTSELRHFQTSDLWNLYIFELLDQIQTSTQLDETFELRDIQNE